MLYFSLQNSELDVWNRTTFYASHEVRYRQQAEAAPAQYNDETQIGAS